MKVSCNHPNPERVTHDHRLKMSLPNSFDVTITDETRSLWLSLSHGDVSSRAGTQDEGERGINPRKNQNWDEDLEIWIVRTNLT